MLKNARSKNTVPVIGGDEFDQGRSPSNRRVGHITCVVIYMKLVIWLYDVFKKCYMNDLRLYLFLIAANTCVILYITFNKQMLKHFIFCKCCVLYLLPV